MAIVLGLALFSITGLPLTPAGDPLLCQCGPIRVCTDFTDFQLVVDSIEMVCDVFTC